MAERDARLVTWEAEARVVGLSGPYPERLVAAGQALVALVGDLQAANARLQARLVRLQARLERLTAERDDASESAARASDLSGLGR